MGTDATAALCFGIDLGETPDMPWDDDKFDYDPETWWEDINDYKEHFKLYDENGNRLPGTTDAKIREYFDHRRKWHEQNPLPFNIVHHGADACASVILTVPGTTVNANWDGPTQVDVEKIRSTSEALQTFMNAVRKYNLVPGGSEPQWLMSCYYG